MDKIFNMIKNALISVYKKIPKNIILCFLVLISLVIFFILASEIYTSYYCKKASISYANKISELNKENIFEISKIVSFSSAFSKSSLNSNSTLILDNVYQYTDIAVYINNNVTEFTNKNTLKSLWLDNIHFDQTEEVGKPNLFFLPLNDFATEKYIDSNIINNRLDFNISSENQIDLSSNTLYNNCANPITLKFVNNNLKENFGTNVSSLQFDGSLLKKCGILLSSIKTNLSFNINIVNNSNEEYKCTISLQIPLENNSSTIYDGSLIDKNETIKQFYRYK